MEVEVNDVEMTPGDISVIRYIAVDTNVLIDELRTVQALFRSLSLPSLHSTVQLLVPQTVLYEIDNHHKLGKPSIRHQAREANRFLNRLIKSKQLDNRVPLRVQKVSEQLRNNLARPDDRILDCCLFFAPECEQVWLWTKDQVFETIARSNDVHILQTVQLANIVRDLGIEGVAGVKQSVELFETCSLVQLESEEGESGMEVDEDLYFDLPALVADIDRHRATNTLAAGPDGTRSLLSDLLSRYSPSTVGAPSWAVEEEMMETMSTSSDSATSSDRPMELPPTKLKRPSLSEHHVHAQLEVALAPLVSYLAVEEARSDRLLKSLLAKLLALEAQLYPDTDGRAPLTQDRQVLLVAIDGTRTLVKYCERDIFDKGQKPRLGAVADAIEALGELCGTLSSGQMGSVDCHELAELVRRH